MMKDSNNLTFWQEFIPKLWTTLKGYSWKLFRKDLSAGLTLGVLALPLAMAFGIASGLTPASGIYASIIVGLIISLLGGGYFQIGGTSAAFVVIIYGIIHDYGYNGLAVATIIAALVLLIAAISRVGLLIQYVPYPLITGFTTGIALIIFITQIKHFFGLQIEKVPPDFFSKIVTLYHAFPTISIHATFVALGTLFVIILLRYFLPVAPWGIISIAVITVITTIFDLPIETVFTRYGEIPRTLAAPSLPDFSILKGHWFPLLENGVTIAFLIGVEALLSAIISDGMTGKTHKSNCELLAQGIANAGSAIFGGLPATGAIARTATNIKTGAQTPVAGIVHSVTLFLIILLFAPLVSKIPLAALSAILMVVAWDMSEIKNFKHLFNAPTGDWVVLLTTFILTVVVNLMVGIAVGLIASAFLFMKRIRDLSGVYSIPLISDEKAEMEIADPDAIAEKRVPRRVEIYEITGMFFFGLADTLKDILSHLEFAPKVFILRMRKIPTIDATGMHGLKEFYYRCRSERTTLILSGVTDTLYEALEKFGVIDLVGKEHIFSHIDPSLEKAEEIVGEKK